MTNLKNLLLKLDLFGFKKTDEITIISYKQTDEITTISYKQIGKYFSPKGISINENYVDTIPNFIRNYRDEFKALSNIIRLLCYKEFMSTKQSQLFAIWCARQVQHLMLDESITALDVAERYINGLATKKELDIARKDAKRIADILFSDNYNAYSWCYAALAAYDATDDDATKAATAASRAAARAWYWDSAEATMSDARSKQLDYLLDLFERGANFD